MDGSVNGGRTHSSLEARRGTYGASLARAGIAAVVAVLGAGSFGYAQQRAPFDRLSADVFDVVAPSRRVAGAPGQMRVSQTSCRQPTGLLDEALRRRIVDVAVQEWAFFGFGVVDQTVVEPGDSLAPASTQNRSRFRWLSSGESARVAASIAGYWTVTPEGGWVIERQNEEWNGPAGIGARWRNPWSAAFISWVMCESGLGDSTRFLRAVAHHRYIDQAIRARDTGASQPAFVAYDAGEAPIAPGDLLCSGRRPAYRTLAERRRQMGEGARTHCDIVVKLDEEHNRILAIGGNVRGAVSLKLLPAVRSAEGELRPRDFSGVALGGSPYRGARPVFAHLKLRAATIEDAALDSSPTIRVLGCTDALQARLQLAAGRNLISTSRSTVTC